MQRQRCLFDFNKSSVIWRVKKAGLRWKQCVSILKRNVSSMGKTRKYEGGWSFTETRRLKAESPWTPSSIKMVLDAKRYWTEPSVIKENKFSPWLQGKRKNPKACKGACFPRCWIAESRLWTWTWPWEALVGYPHPRNTDTLIFQTCSVSRRI